MLVCCSKLVPAVCPTLCGAFPNINHRALPSMWFDIFNHSCKVALTTTGACQGLYTV